MCTQCAGMSVPHVMLRNGGSQPPRKRGGDPPAGTGEPPVPLDPLTGTGGLTLRLHTPREPRHGSSRWSVIRYALGSNARTARLCVIWVVVTGGPVAGPITYWILHIR